jgi:hypothetical protein
MQAMLRRALEAVLQKHLAMKMDVGVLSKNIASTWKFDITYSKLTRLPLSELKTALKVPCPVIENGKEGQQIAAFKRLRERMTVEESAVCLKCTRKCPFRNVSFKEMAVAPETTNKAALHDLLSFLIALAQKQENEYSDLRWNAAYKVVLALDPFLKDLSVISKESLLFREVMKAYEEE